MTTIEEDIECAEGLIEQDKLDIKANEFSIQSLMFHDLRWKDTDLANPIKALERNLDHLQNKLKSDENWLELLKGSKDAEDDLDGIDE